MGLPPRPCRVGVDIGGTFTDVALRTDGKIQSTKVLTNHSAPERGVVAAVIAVARTAEIAPGDIAEVIHGTTLATNALIERRGAPTAFLTTEGFRDVLEMRTENRFEQYDVQIKLPPALIERADRIPVCERVDAAGGVLVPLDKSSLARALDRVQAGGFESVAIGFIHAYANGEHERQARATLLERLPHLSVSISSEVSPQLREFERFNTVCANAYVKPVMKSYLDRLTGALVEVGVACPIYMIHSGGGMMSVADAGEFPVRLIESGPAGGAIFAAELAQRHALDRVLSFDMGGTTAKICLIEGGVPKSARTFEVGRTYRFRKGSGIPISIPVVEMVEIGAGGGSIAAVDSMRQIRVGPQSAGSDPGPACYQRGGDRPTVTDADVVLGRLDPDHFAGGAIPLSAKAARAAFQQHVAQRVGVDVEAGAYGACEIVDENMANAGRVHAVENGKDISAFTMVAFGGAGPAHAARLAEKLGMGAFLVPPGAGVGSAIGFLHAPFGYESVRSGVFNLSCFDWRSANRLLESMREEAAGFLAGGLEHGEPIVERTLFMRYAGQGWYIPVGLPAGTFDERSAGFLRTLFEAAYERFFGRSIAGLEIEIVSWSVRATSPLPPTARVPPASRRGPAPHSTRRPVFDPASGTYQEAGIYERSRLTVGDVVTGPAVVVEDETSTVLTAAFDAAVQSDGSLLVTRRVGGAA